jgi:hypothetical protein
MDRQRMGESKGEDTWRVQKEKMEGKECEAKERNQK